MHWHAAVGTKPIPQIKGLNINDTFNTQDQAAAGMAKDGTVSVSEVKGETLADELGDDGGDATLWMHRGTEMEDAFAEDESSLRWPWMQDMNTRLLSANLDYDS